VASASVQNLGNLRPGARNRGADARSGAGLLGRGAGEAGSARGGASEELARDQAVPDELARVWR
jgi:hypothetical protein